MSVNYGGYRESDRRHALALVGELRSVGRDRLRARRHREVVLAVTPGTELAVLAGIVSARVL